MEVSSLAQTSSAVASSTDGSINADSVDGTPDPQRTKVAITHLQQKILKLTEQIKIEQTARDDNVAEYLKLANNADKQQSARIKQVFEKKNQKSAQTILQLQKKLEHYHRKLREIEQNGIPRQPKDVFRDMHQGLKDVGAKVTGFSEGVVDSVKGGLSSFSQATHSAAGAVVSKPREIASLIRNKFGSADNIANLKDSLEEGQEDGTGGKALGVIQNFQSSPKYGSEEDCSSATSGSVGANSTTGGPVGASSSKTNTLDMQSSGFDAILHEIQEIRETQARLEESFEDLKVRYQRDYSLIMQTLQEERYRYVLLYFVSELNTVSCRVPKSWIVLLSRLFPAAWFRGEHMRSSQDFTLPALSFVNIVILLLISLSVQERNTEERGYFIALSR